jgi:hypothetical protein
VNIRLVHLKLRTRQTTELVAFSPIVSFFHGPVSTGKSTIARLIDYCLGGSLERTPAIRQEFVACGLLAEVGMFRVQFERGAQKPSSVRVTWSDGQQQMGSVNTPLEAAADPIFGDDVFNLSDLIFKLAGIQPIKVRRSKFDPDSPLVRLSFRDLMWYCYLRQDHLDSSFFSLEDPGKRLKSQDATGRSTHVGADPVRLRVCRKHSRGRPRGSEAPGASRLTRKTTGVASGHRSP